MVKKKTIPNTEEPIIRVDGEIKRRENRYYAKVADRYRIGAFLIVLLLVVMGGVLMVLYGEHITYDNFVYMLRDFDSVAGGGNSFSEVTFTAQEKMKFERFRDGFAVIGTDEVTLFDQTGVELCSESENFSYPAGSGSEKYILVYDIGGSSYSLYNSVTRVMKGTTEKPIISASVSDTGSFIVTTESDDSKYLTEMYNSAFKRTMTVYKDKYVIASAISMKGDTFAIASVTEDGTDFYAELAFYEKGKELPVSTYTYSMSMPLSLESFEDGGFVLLSDDGIRFYDEKGKLKSETDLEGKDPLYFDSARSGAVLVCSVNAIGTKSNVYSFDSAGKLIYDGMIDKKVIGAYASATPTEYACYLLSTNGVIAVKPNGEEIETKFGEDILALTDTAGGPVVMTAEKAFRLFSKK